MEDPHMKDLIFLEYSDGKCSLGDSMGTFMITDHTIVKATPISVHLVLSLISNHLKAQQNDVEEPIIKSKVKVSGFELRFKIILEQTIYAVVSQAFTMQGIYFKDKNECYDFCMANIWPKLPKLGTHDICTPNFLPTDDIFTLYTLKEKDVEELIDTFTEEIVSRYMKNIKGGKL